MFSNQDLNDVYGFYLNLDTYHNGFIETRLKLRDEFDSRPPDDLLKAMI